MRFDVETVDSRLLTKKCVSVDTDTWVFTPSKERMQSVNGVYSVTEIHRCLDELLAPLSLQIKLSGGEYHQELGVFEFSDGHPKHTLYMMYTLYWANGGLKLIYYTGRNIFNLIHQTDYLSTYESEHLFIAGLVANMNDDTRLCRFLSEAYKYLFTISKYCMLNQKKLRIRRVT